MDATVIDHPQDENALLAETFCVKSESLQRVKPL